MKKIYITCYFLIISLLFAGSLTAQLNYAITTTTPGFTALTGPSLTAIPFFDNSCGDQMVSSAINLGFTFKFGGLNYTQVKVSDNGEIFLGTSALTCNEGCSGGGGSCSYDSKEPPTLAAGVLRPAICPLWDDLGFTVNGSKVSSQPTGTVAPNRTMTIEWTLMEWKYNNPNSPHGTISFQAILYESPAGQIDFIYSNTTQTLGIGVKAPSSRIGLMGTANTDWYSLNSTTHTISKAAPEYTVTGRPVQGIRYRWTVPGTAPIDLISFTGENTPAGNLLEWKTATESNNEYYTLERSADGNSFVPVINLDGAGNSNTLRSYKYTDISFPLSDEIVYYRLKQTDYDKTSKYSPIIAVDISSSQKNPPIVYFDYNTAELSISYNFTHTGIYPIEITDPLGRLVYRSSLEIISKEKNRKISLSFPDRGIYIIRMFEPEGNALTQSKFIK